MSVPKLNKQPSFHRPSHFAEHLSHLLWIPTFNKGTGFTEEERKKYKLRGLLPPRVETIEEQEHRAVSQLRGFETSIERYIYLASLQGRNETLFYKVLLNHLEETLPIVYTPTVGEACQKFAHNYRNAQGMYFTLGDKGEIRQILDNWPQNDVQIIVVTDGSRILGLGDLGANGMGIPIGKLSLYVAGSGFHPSGTLPVLLDVGTNNKALLNDPEYLGCRHPRVGGEEYYALVQEFLEAVSDKWPNALVQFEDFSNDHAFDLLDLHRHKFLCFNDDIQGTGAVILSGFINSLRIQNLHPRDTRMVFYGAGSAGVGVADMIVAWFEELGLTNEEARGRFWFVDSQGLITADRGDELASHKVRYARHDNQGQQYKDLQTIVDFVKPTALIGLSGQPRAFTEEIVRAVAAGYNKPIIMALSNPTDKAECTAEQAYTWTDGNAIFAAGSPFPPVEYKGKTYIPGQGNNMFIFPGLGFGAYTARCKTVSEPMIIAAAKTLAHTVTDEEIASGNIYPSLKKIRAISANIAAAVGEVAWKDGHSKIPKPEGDLRTWFEEQMYSPEYLV